MTLRELAEQFWVHETMVSKCLHDLAVPLRRQSLSGEQRVKAVRLYQAGRFINRVGDKFGGAHTTIRNVLLGGRVARRDSHGRKR